MRRGFVSLLILVMLVCCLWVYAPGAKATGHSHCVCGGTAGGIGDHICENAVTWEPWDGTTTLKDGGHYYLNDTDGDGKIVLSSTLTIEKKTVSICLNGVELTCAGRTLQVNGKMESGKTYPAGLNICDCTGKGSVTSTSQGIAPVLHSYTSKRSEVTINLYGGSLVAKDNDATTDSDAGVLRVGNNTESSGSKANHKATFNMYGGNISGGQTKKSGGNVYVSTDCEFNMYAGTVSGGYAGINGGNFYLGGHLNLQGGTVSGGSAELGGGVYLSESDEHKATITLGGTAQIVDNAKSNLYLPQNKTVTVKHLAKPARIGVTPVTTTNFASTANESDARYFFSDAGKYAVVYSSGVLKLGSHAHCVCGGSVAGHDCTNITWTSLSAALTAKGMTADTADFGKLAAGQYFLDCDVTVTGSTNVTKNISLCLNGYSISREEGKIFGYLKNGYTLNICDCSGSQVDGRWSWKGSVNGGTNTYGSVIYTHYGSTLNIYGGNFTGKGTSNGGVIVVANDGAPDLNQDGTVSGEEKNLATPSVLNLYNGSIYGSQTAVKNSTIASYHTALAYWYGGQLHAGKIAGVGEIAVILNADQALMGSYTTLEEALKAVKKDQYIRLIADVQESCTISGAAHLDLNGHSLSGITITGQLYAFDTAGGGSLSCTGQPVIQHNYQGISYIMLPEGNGQWSIHYGAAQITKISLKPNCSGMGYKASFHVDDVVAQSVSSYGYQLWLDGYPIHTYTTNKNFVPGKELTLGLKNVLSADNDLLTNVQNANQKVYARAVICFKDGTILKSEAVSYNLREMLELADTHYSNFSSTQKDALQTMYSNYESLLLGWDMPNIIHADGWTEVSQKQFEENLTKSGNDYLIAPGKYTLTEDFDLSNKVLKVAEDKQVTICLNGHTISGTARLFKVYGTLNICDCHSDEQEGTLTSALAAESAESQIYAPIAYIYPGTMNIYGGKLIATEKVVSGGVIAVGSGTYHGVQKTPGVLNIMGGHLSGGQTFTSGGLIWVLDKATMNMYDGTLAGGVSDGNGGAIYGGGNTTLNLYGGTVADSTSGNYGGGVYGANDAALLLGSDLILNNNTAVRGGNVYNSSEKSLVIDGAVITNGKAEVAGGVYSNTSEIILSGDPVIRDNENGSLYLMAHNTLDADQLGSDADVHIYNVSSRSLHTNTQGLTLERDGYKFASIGGQTVLIPESFTVPTEVEGFQVGFGRADITPTEIGLPLAGYGNSSSRLSTTTAVNAYDELKVSCVAITDEAGETVLLLGVDLIRPGEDLMATIFPAITAATGVPESHIFTNFTHTHSVPETKQINNSKIQRYNAMLPDRFAQAANLAMNDRQPSTMQTGSFEVEGLNFTRHYTYQENGETKYAGDNFGVVPTDNSTLKHVTEADHTMHMVRFVRAGTDILMANWRVHPHMTGGGTKTYVSADIIGTTRYYFERDMALMANITGKEEYRMHFMYLQGAAGNINETSKIKSEQHGLNYTQYGNKLSNQISEVIFDKALQDTQTGLWQVDNYSYTAVSDIASENEYEHAKAASADFNAWLEENPNATSTQKKAKCEELGYLTWFHFNNVITRHGLEPTCQLPLNTFALGNSLAFYTAPGELWDTVSMEMEEASPFDMTLCIGYSQDHYNYFVYDPNNGGQMTYESYESNNYRFVAPNTINDMIAYWKQTLATMYANLEN